MDGKPRTFEVYGTISGHRGHPLRGARVAVFLHHIRARHELACGEADEHGRYRLAFLLPETRAGKPLISVEAGSAEFDRPLASRLLEARPELLVDLHADARDDSEWTRLERAICPLLDGLALKDVCEDEHHRDLSFLARELDTNTEQMARVVVAARLEARNGVAAPAFYAFLAQRTPPQIPMPLLGSVGRLEHPDLLVGRIGSLLFALGADVQRRALRTAAERNLIAPISDESIDQIVRRLHELGLGDLLARPYAGGSASLGELLGAVQLPHEKQTALASALRLSSLPAHAFWASLSEGKQGLSAGEVTAIQNVVSLSALVDGRLQLVKALLARLSQSATSALPELGRLTEQDWLGLIEENGGAPAGTGAEAAKAFAADIATRVARKFPTVSLVTRVVSSELLPQEDRTLVTRFLATNVGLELSATNLTLYLEERGKQAWAGLDSKQQRLVLGHLKRLQRLLLIDADPETAHALAQMGMTSAMQIASMGRQQFAARAKKVGLSPGQAAAVFDTSSHRYAGVVSRFLKFNRGALAPWPKMLGSLLPIDDPTQRVLNRDGSLGTLFGSVDYCQVDACTSLLSPAAYLCDLLLWLRNHPLSSGETALDVFDGLRPDVRNLLLNCPNTQTPLPYIDLVIELLSDAVQPPRSDDPDRWKQTAAEQSAAELRAAPHYFNATAFDTLATSSYPHTLPYSAGLDELRSYLAQMGLPLFQVRDALRPPHEDPMNAARRVCERFGMPAQTVDLIAVDDSPHASSAWNLAHGEAPSVLNQVPRFLDAAAISYETLLELRELEFVKGTGAFDIAGVDDSCATSQQTLTPSPLPLDLLDRAHRLLRLWRSTGYKLWELDLLLRSTAVGNGSLDYPALVELVAFRKLQDSSGLAVDALLAIFQGFDTVSHRDPDGTSTTPLYRRLFLNPSVGAASDPDLEALLSGGTLTHPQLSDHLPAIQAALGLLAGDAPALFALTDGQLTLENLRFLYAVSTLGGLTGYTVMELLALLRLLAPPGSSNFSPLWQSPAAVLKLLERVAAVRDSGFSLDELSYLLKPPPWTSAAAMNDTEIGAALASISAALASAPPRTSLESTIRASAHHATRSALNDVEASAKILSTLVVPGTSVALYDAISAIGAGVLAPTRDAYPSEYFAVQLYDKAALVADRLTLTKDDLTWLIANSGTYGGLPFAQLPVQTPTDPTSPSDLSLDVLLNTVLLVKLNRLFRAAPLGATTATLFDLIQTSGTTLADETAARSALSVITGWANDDITAFASALELVFPGDYRQPATYESLRFLEAMATNARLSGEQLASWGLVPSNESDARSKAAAAQSALKATYPDNDKWLAFAPTLMDPLREHRANALQAYLIGRRRRPPHDTLLYPDTVALFDHFLIDTQMSSCELTTRVVQAYVAVQIFVERCLMGVQNGVAVDLAADDTWSEWKWMKRYRIWEANRKVFLYPENWLDEGLRPDQSEIFQQFTQEVRQNENTLDHLETVAQNYVERLEELSHLVVTGTFLDGTTMHVVACSPSDPPQFYYRSRVDGVWSGWGKIPFVVKQHELVPAVCNHRTCLFWLDVRLQNEPQQEISAPQQSSTPPSQDAARYASIALHFSVLRAGAWSPPQQANGKLFDIPFPLPLPNPPPTIDEPSVNRAYSIKVKSEADGTLSVDVYRLGGYRVVSYSRPAPEYNAPDQAVHIGRALFRGRFGDLMLTELATVVGGSETTLLSHARSTYGADAAMLLPLDSPEPNLLPEDALVPSEGILATRNASGTGALTLLSPGGDPVQLLASAPAPFRVVGPSNVTQLDFTVPFFYQDNQRAYLSSPNTLFLLFTRFYHPYAQLLWDKLAEGGFEALYDRNLQLTPADVARDAFRFSTVYQPAPGVLTAQGEMGDEQDREILDFSRMGAYSVYNWELFFHAPLYVAERLSQSQRFEDALKWYRFIFDPTHAGPEPIPQRYWIPKPLHRITAPNVLAQQIEALLEEIDAAHRDSSMGLPETQAERAADEMVKRWRRDPFNPFLLADLRPVAYMKRALMSYLDNLIAWADNLFATDSREALNEATLLYVMASEILGTKPVAVTPPERADKSFAELEPALDDFANAMVDIENVVGSGTGGGGGDGMPRGQTFYFKIPPNEKLLSYWETVEDRLFKLRHCQNIKGATRELALFDAPIDPALLVRARAAGVDVASVLNDLLVTQPAYRFSSLYQVATDFVAGVREYGAALLAALASRTGEALAALSTGQQQRLLDAEAQIYELQVSQAEQLLEAANQGLELAQSSVRFYGTRPFMTDLEQARYVVEGTRNFLFVLGTAIRTSGVAAAEFPDFVVGAAGFGGSPMVYGEEGATHVSDSIRHAAEVGEAIGKALEVTSELLKEQSEFGLRRDEWRQKNEDAHISARQAQAQIKAAEFALEIAQKQRETQQARLDTLTQTMDFLTSKFTSQELYDWMIAQLSDTYFQCYRLAYKLCRQVEQCYEFELGLRGSAQGVRIIRFGQWDSLRNGLLAGEALNLDLRRLKAAYLEQDARRFELSRWISLKDLDSLAFAQLQATGSGDFTLPESLFDRDYPGHYDRRLARVSVTVVYPSPGRFDNIKGTLTLASNKVRVDKSATIATDYPELAGDRDSRFVYSYAAVPQRIALSTGQDDPGTFADTVQTSLSDPRYAPFENAGAVSRWHLELPAASNEIPISGVTDVVLRIHYTAAYGGDALRDVVQASSS